MPWFLGFEFKYYGFCVHACMFFFVGPMWPSLSPCEGRVEASCKLFVSINYAITYLGII